MTSVCINSRKTSSYIKLLIFSLCVGVIDYVLRLPFSVSFTLINKLLLLRALVRKKKTSDVVKRDTTPQI